MFQYLDSDQDGEIQFEDFKMLDEEHQRKNNPFSLAKYLEITGNYKEHDQKMVDRARRTKAAKSTAARFQNMTIDQLERSANKKNIRQLVAGQRNVYGGLTSKVFTSIKLGKVADPKSTTPSKVSSMENTERSRGSFFKKKSSQLDPLSIYGHLNQVIQPSGQVRNIDDMCHGKPGVLMDPISEIIQGSYLRKSIEDRLVR